MLESDDDLPPTNNDADGVCGGIEWCNDLPSNSSITTFESSRSSSNSRHSSSSVRRNAASSPRSRTGSCSSSDSIHDSVMLESMKSSGLEIFAHDIFKKSHHLSSTLVRTKSESEIIISLSQMGFEEEDITRTVDNLKNSGVVKVDMYDAVCALLMLIAR